MNLLLDTHILLWWLAGSVDVPKAARTAIEDSPLTYVSAATAWEIGIKMSRGKLQVRGDLKEHLTLNRFRELQVTVAHAMAAAKLPMHHRDPFDRMLVAQASLESLTLVTRDARLKAYGIRILIV